MLIDTTEVESNIYTKVWLQVTNLSITSLSTDEHGHYLYIQAMKRVRAPFRFQVSNLVVAARLPIQEDVC